MILTKFQHIDKIVPMDNTRLAIRNVPLILSFVSSMYAFPVCYLLEIFLQKCVQY